jgi:hypothetical protein
VTPIPAYGPLPEAAKDKIASTDVVLPIKQSEIYVFVPDSRIAAAGGGGLLLALVDAGVNSVRTSKAEAAVKPLRDAIVDFNFDDALQSDLRADFAGTPWLHTGSYRVMKDASPAGLDSAIDMSNASAVLLATTDYHLSNDADVLTVTMAVGLYPKADALLALHPSKGSPKSSLANTLYHNTLTFETTQPGGQDNRDQNIAKLSAKQRRSHAGRVEIRGGQTCRHARG